MNIKSVGRGKRSVFWMCLALTCATPGLGGCSLLFTTSPPSNAASYPQGAEIDCTTSKVAPVVDSVIAGLQVARTGLAIAARDRDYRESPISREADIGFGLGLTALFLGSAIYGYAVTGKCADVKARHEADIALATPESAPLTQ